MEKIGSYGIYQNNVYGQNKAATNSSKANETKKATETKDSKVELSSGAKKLLKELQKTYGNTDFMIANYETEEEAAEYLSRGTNTYSVLLTPDELEKMASDEKYKKSNLEKLDGALDQLKDVKSQLGEKGEDVKRLGVVIGDNGEVSYFAELEKSSEMQRERIEKHREAKKEEAAEAAKEKKDEKVNEGSFIREGAKRTTLFADSLEELKEKIGQVDWNTIREGGYDPRGGRFDFTV